MKKYVRKSTKTNKPSKFVAELSYFRIVEIVIVIAITIPMYNNYTARARVGNAIFATSGIRASSYG